MRVKRKEMRALSDLRRNKTEKKMEAAIRHSKASSPYLVPSGSLVDGVHDETDKPYEFSCWHHPNVLTLQNKEIPREMPEGKTVIVVLDNNGKGARKIELSGDVVGGQIRQEPKIEAAHGLTFFKYPYDPKSHGKQQRIEISFETEDGHRLTHVYLTKHGYFEFRRIEPD